jgi:hypothetical protein
MFVEMPKTVLNMSLTPTQGKYTFDSSKKTLNWEIGRIDPSKVPTIRGNVCFTLISSLIFILFKMLKVLKICC